MGLPSDLTTIMVTGTYESITGAPLSGQVNFSVLAPIQDSTGKVILGAGTQSAVLSGTGSLSIILPCTDNADLSPSNFSYLVTEVIPGLGRAYYIQLPHTLGTTVDLSQLAPVSPPPAASAFSSINTWTAKQVFSGNPALEITTGAVAGDVLTSDASGNATWQAPSAGFTNPMTTLGDLIYENATPAAARLPGSISASKSFLTQTGTGSLSAAPAWGVIAASDLAATASQLGYTQLTLSPSGSLAWGLPWQFHPEAYGAKGDGKQALVTTSSSNGVINTTPLGAPSAPTLSNTGTGGTVLAGTYQVKVTYVNAYGETIASSAASTTTAGSASVITINSPAPFRDATGWYAYVTQANGAVFTRQQTAGQPTAIEVPLKLSAPPTSSGASPPGSDGSAAQVFTSTAADGGKNVIICGGQGSPGAPWIDTIASVQSPTQATLTTATTGSLVNQAGCAMVFSSDDRLAIDQCISAAAAYAVANDFFCQVIFSSKIYGLGSSLFQTTAPNGSVNPGTLGYNTQVRIPVGNASGQTAKLEIQLLGPGDNAHNYFWVSMLPNLNGCSLVSYSSGPQTPDSTFGQQSVIGGPTGGVNFNGSNAFANVKAVIKGIQVVQPGWSNSIGIDLFSIAGCALRGSSMAYAPTTSIGGGVNPSFAWPGNSFFQQKSGIGLRLPGGGNNDDVVVESFAVEGITTCLATAADHVVIDRLSTINSNIAISFSGGPNTHAFNVAQWSYENVNGAFNVTGGSGPCMVGIVMDGENSSVTYDVNDPNNVLTGVIHWRDIFRASNAPTNAGATGVQFWNDSLSPGHWAGAPIVPLSTAAQQNTAWRAASITVHTGVGVTVSAISIDGTVTGLTMAASSSLLLPVLPAGKNVVLTYSGGTPTWDWWLG